MLDRLTFIVMLLALSAREGCSGEFCKRLPKLDATKFSPGATEEPDEVDQKKEVSGGMHHEEPKTEQEEEDGQKSESGDKKDCGEDDGFESNDHGEDDRSGEDHGKSDGGAFDPGAYRGAEVFR